MGWKNGGRRAASSAEELRLPARLTTAYCAAKHGVLGLTRALAEELRSSNIQVNAVCPGYIETEMTATLPETAKAKLLEPALWSNIEIVAPTVPRWRYRETIGYVRKIHDNYERLKLP